MGRRRRVSSEIEAALASWNRAPGEAGTAARLEAACSAVAWDEGLSATDVRIRLADAARAKLGTSVEIVALPPAKPPRPEGRKDRPRLAPAVLVSVTGPLSWSWWWPTSSTEHILKRAASAVARLSAKEAPFGVYRVRVNSSEREVVRSAAEER